MRRGVMTSLSWLMFLLIVSWGVLAQSDCPALVKAALDAVDGACSATGRNQVCYGNIQLNATARPNVTAFQFQQTGDIANVASLQTLQLSSMSLDSGAWGVALMELQANLPDSVPGQNVTFLLFGDVQIDNAVPDAPEVPFKAKSNANIRLRPTTKVKNVMGSLSKGQDITATGRLADNSWVRIKVEGDARGVGWVSAEFVEGDLTALAVVEPDAPAMGPMQAFYFKSGVGDRPCAQAPDSGILVQSPKGAVGVNFTVNDVQITLGSTVYLQAGKGYLTVSVVEGQATLTAAGASQVVPAGTFSRVPLDASNHASGKPEFPKPYDDQALQTLPLRVKAFNAVQITPPLKDSQIQAAVQAAQSPTSGTWALSVAVVSNNCANTTAQGANVSANLTFKPDGSLTMVVGKFTSVWKKSGSSYISSQSVASPGNSVNYVYTLTFTSPTSATGQETATLSNGCQIKYTWNMTLVTPAG